MKKAQSLIEYALILVLISLVAITTLNIMGKNMSLKNKNTQINTEQNIKESMTQYCALKGLAYNETTQKCEVNSTAKK